MDRNSLQALVLLGLLASSVSLTLRLVLAGRLLTKR